MEVVVQTAWECAWNDLLSELKIMPLNRWNESVYRYWFCRAVAKSFPNVEQFVECDRIDLVLADGDRRAFVEFKFYHRPPKCDPYTGTAQDRKGGPGVQNFNEFVKCVNKLHQRDCIDGLSKYIVQVYADPQEQGRYRTSYRKDYAEYQHPDPTVPIQLVHSKMIVTEDGFALASNLYQIS